MNRVIVLILLFGIHGLRAYNQMDSMVLTSERFLNLVKQYHPMTKLADLRVKSGQAGLLKARGNFDPKLSVGNNQKFYDNTGYFNLATGTISVPTMFGLELKGGFDQNRGSYLNPENKTPDSGLGYAGITFTAGQGLFIDERRLALKQADVFQKSTVAERASMINDLIYDAGKAYWNWYAAYHNLEIYKVAYSAAIERFESVKIAASLGDRPYIDTLEAFIQVNERQFSLIQSEMEFKNTSIALSFFLWDENGQPLMLEPGVKAPDFSEFDTDNVLLPDSNAWKSHPEISMYAFKIQTLNLEKRWKKEQLKPVLNMSYQPYIFGQSVQTFSSNDYKFGLTFKMPLFLRKERGDLKLTEFKIREATYDLNLKRQAIQTKSLIALNEFDYTLELIGQYRGTVDAYFRLLEAEKSIFRTGESSLFLINARELSYISARLKLVDVAVKNRKAVLDTYYMSGLLGL